MNKILLCYPPGPLYQRGEDRCQGNIEDSAATSMRACNDLGYAAAVLLRDGFSIRLRDYQTERVKEIDVYKDIITFAPEMIMISVTNATIYDDISFVKKLHKYSDAVIVLKGAIFYAPEKEMLDMLDLSEVAYLIGGEVDYCIDRIAAFHFHGKGKLSDINNICYKDGDGNIKINRFHVWEDNLDLLPFPARDYMKNELYVRPDTGAPMATIQTSRGCPAGCIYCLSSDISGKKVRFRSPHNVMKEITECYEKYGIKDFFFKADTFTINAEWTKELCELIIASPLNGKIAFTANSRVNPLKKETLQLMKKAGCFTIAFGFESGSEESLQLMKKGASVGQNRQAMKWARQAGIPVYGFYLIGFPWETSKHLEETRKLIFELDADFIEIHIALPYYGTPLYEKCKEEGVLADNVYGNDYFHSATVGTKHISMKELTEFRAKTLRSYYMRPHYIRRKLLDCISNPKIFVHYVQYGVRLLKSIKLSDRGAA